MRQPMRFASNCRTSQDYYQPVPRDQPHRLAAGCNSIRGARLRPTPGRRADRPWGGRRQPHDQLLQHQPSPGGR